MRDEERRARAREAPIVDGLPDLPGIIVAMNLAPTLAGPLRGLANALLVDEFPGSTLRRGERELLATATSARNDCFYCMDTHGAFAAELLRRDQAPAVEALIDAVKSGALGGLDPKLSALAAIARRVAQEPRALDRADVARAKAAGATDGDVQLAILIASAFCMYNRMVDGLRARTPADVAAYEARAREIAEYGYADPRTASIPRTD
ncbi:MAG: carboxymuconolactone decarboxylase family protein [Roseiarcus sp.]